MAPKTIQGSPTLANIIRGRRIDLEMSIEEAAQKAGVSAKTWCRYEAGGSIRTDKYRIICKILNLKTELDEDVFNLINNYKREKKWSKYLENYFGEFVALSFSIGSEILLEDIDADITEILKLPGNSHLGQISGSIIVDSLPQQFITRYNYDFLYQLRANIISLRRHAFSGNNVIAHSVFDELSFVLIAEEAETVLDEEIINMDWVFDLFDDMDIRTFLYNDLYLPETHQYHFSHWYEKTFYVDD